MTNDYLLQLVGYENKYMKAKIHGNQKYDQLELVTNWSRFGPTFTAPHSYQNRSRNCEVLYGLLDQAGTQRYHCHRLIASLVACQCISKRGAASVATLQKVNFTPVLKILDLVNDSAGVALFCLCYVALDKYPQPN